VDGDPLDAAEWFVGYAQDALDSLPSDLRARMSNVEIVVEDEPPIGQRLLGLYQGVPLTRRSSYYGGALPDKITIYRGPLVRVGAHRPLHRPDSLGAARVSAGARKLPAWQGLVR
jgi:predicted Zn-dependent protease with MMP-like domain